VAALQRSGHGQGECLERGGHEGTGLLVTGDELSGTATVAMAALGLAIGS
jgi:hypothetical protein